MDDILYSGNRNEIKEFERIIKERYEVRIDNEVKDFLRITIIQVKNESKVTLRQYSTIKKWKNFSIVKLNIYPNMIHHNYQYSILDNQEIKKIF